MEILSDFNQNNLKSKDDYVIFYCIEYNKGTTIEEMEYKIYEKLVEIKKKIYFIITKTNYDINKEPEDERTKEKREEHREKIEKAIKDIIKNICQKSQINAEDFIKNYITIDYVNLIRDYEVEPYVPVFGIDKVLSHFSKLYSDEKWNELEEYCKKKNGEKCEEYCKENYFLKNFSKFNNINEKNEIEANEYLKGLKAGAFFSGMIPGLDIGMEYYYKSKFKEKLESLYGFSYDEAKTDCKEGNKSIISHDDENYEFSDKPITPLKGEINDYEKILNDKEKKGEEMEDNNIGKNIGCIVRGGGEIGGIILKALPTAGEITLESGTVVVRTGISFGIKAVSWVLLPVTCVSFGTWSLLKVNKDCKKMLKLFQEAYSLRFKTLYAYINSFRKAIKYLKSRGEKIIEEDHEEN